MNRETLKPSYFSRLQETCVKIEDEEVEDNPYRVLVEKYEALLEVQRHPAPRRKASGPTGGCLSLQEELVMSGDFNSFTNTSQSEVKSIKAEVEAPKSTKPRSLCKKPFSGTPTDLSEAESSSSGFSDETSNKATQTDDRTGSLLCSIADGEDCKFSIYDDASPIESRFRKTPEYRQTFQEIFRVLKRAADAKDEGEKLPLLDEIAKITSSHANAKHRVSQPVSNDICDDTQSVVSSVVSEPPYRSQTPKPTNKVDKATGNSPADQRTNGFSRHVQYTPIKRQPLEYLSIGVNVRKKSSAKKNSAKKILNNERPSTPDSTQNTNPKVVQSRTNSGGKRRFRALPMSNVGSPENQNVETGNGTVWNGNTLNFFPSKTGGQRETTNGGSRQSNSFVRYVSEQHSVTATYEYRPSAASAEVARLKRLEMSYAEALRMPNKPKITNNRRH